MSLKAGGAALALVLAAAAQQSSDKPIVEMNGGLTAQLLSLGRDSSGGRPVITAAVKITNAGRDHVLLMFYDAPSAIDDAGVKFEGDAADSISGAGWCRTRPAEQCTSNSSNVFPMQNYTEIDPGRSITVHFKMKTPSPASKGKRISIAAQIAYRLVNDPAKDDDLSDSQKLRQVRKGNMSFEPLIVTDL